MMQRMKSFLRRFRRDQDGVAAFDFMLIFPLYFLLFLASFETSMVMLRQVLLDRGVEQAVRIVRLNTLSPPNYDQMKTMICQGAGLIANCQTSLKLEMWMQDPRGTMLLTSKPDCIDRSLQVQPASIYQPGAQNQIMFVRACVKYEPFFPTAVVGTARVDSAGEYTLVSTNIYVTEPSG